jgi:hypothetical protein
LMDWLSLRNRHATPLHLWPEKELPPVGNAWLAQEAKREILARTVESWARPLFAAIIVLLIFFTYRSWKRRQERF